MTVSLDAALSGLRVAQQAIDIASTNVANASTPGYTRKVLPQETVVVGNTTVGARAGVAFRTVDQTLINATNKQSTVNGYYTITQKYLSRIQDYHGASDANRSISAQIANLANTFTQLSATPDNTALLTQAVSAATQVTDSINGFAEVLSTLRQQNETDIASSVAQINQALDLISNLNQQITAAAATQRSTADLEDQRDSAIAKIAQYIDISTYPADNSVSIFTKSGRSLLDSSVHLLTFSPSSPLASSYYPGGGINGIKIEGIADITTESIGGQLGALVDMRDTTLPQYQAQLDELAQKLAERFDDAGLRLFTDFDGNVPASSNSGIPSYVGFSAQMRVNVDILNDPQLIRNGTTGNTESTGSAEVIRRVVANTFGTYWGQTATGTLDISSGQLYAQPGFTVMNRMTGSVNLTSYSPDLSAIPGTTLPGTFNLTLGGLMHTITVGAADTAAALAASINTAFSSNVASINADGQLSIAYAGNIVLANNTIGAPTINALGLSFGTKTMPQPSFSIQVGTRSPITISIGPSDDATDLINRINSNVPGLTASLSYGGVLLLTPDNGGDIKIANVSGTPLSALGMSINNVAQTSFRQSGVGPDGNVATGLLANSSITDYAGGMIGAQAEDASIASSRQEQEATFLQTLQTRRDNDGGVNIDEEMANLIRIQSAYAAAARMITASSKMFDDLLSSFR